MTVSKLERKERKNHSNWQGEARRIMTMMVYKNLKSRLGRNELLKDLKKWFVVKIEAAMISEVEYTLALKWLVELK